MATKKSSAKKQGRGKVREVMHEFKEGELKSGGKKPVKNQKQAVAIALSEARRSGANIPDKRSAAAKKTAAKKGAAKKGGKKATKQTAAKKTAVKKSAGAKKTSVKKTAAKKAAKKSGR